MSRRRRRIPPQIVGGAGQGSFDRYLEGVIQPDMLLYCRETSIAAGNVADNAMYTTAPGPELVTNGDGTTLTGWSTTGTPTTLEVTGGRFHVVADANGEGFSQSITAQIGDTFRVEFDVELISGSMRGQWTQDFTNVVALGLQHYSFDFVAAAGGIQTFLIRSNSAAEFYIDNIALKKVGQLDGSYSGQTLSGNTLLGFPCPTYDKVNDTLQLEFNRLESILPQVAGQLKGTISIVVNWSQADWEELVDRVIYAVGVDANNLLILQHAAVSGDLRFNVAIGGTLTIVNTTIPSSLYGKPTLITATWDEATDSVNLYVNGVLVDSDVFPNGVWTATALTAGFCRIGSLNGGSFMGGSAGIIWFKAAVVPATQIAQLGVLLQLSEAAATLNAGLVFFKDTFDIDDAAPLTSPLPATPGPGNWAVTDTNTRMSKAGGNLDMAAGAGVPGLVAPSPTYRRPGIALVVQAASDGDAGGGWGFDESTTLVASYQNMYYSFINSLFALNSNNGGNIQNIILPTPTPSNPIIVLRSTGALFYTKIGANWVLQCADPFFGSVAKLWAQIVGAGGALTGFAGIKVVQLGPPFSSDYGVVQFNDTTLASGDLFTGLADGQYTLDHAIPGAPADGNFIEIRFRRQDANNYVRVRMERIAGLWSVTLDKIIAGAVTPVSTLSANAGAARGIGVNSVGSRVLPFYWTSANLIVDVPAGPVTVNEFTTQVGAELVWSGAFTVKRFTCEPSVNATVTALLDEALNNW